MDVTEFFAKNGRYPNWDNLTIADKKSHSTKADYEVYVDFLEEWDEALKEDRLRNPDTCYWSDTANVGYGPDEVMTCGDKATFLVTYEVYIPETDVWEPVTTNSCPSHVHLIEDDTARVSNNSDMLRNWVVTLKTPRTCNCESSWCDAHRPSQNCPNVTKAGSPRMVYVGEICVQCAQDVTRVYEYGKEYITAPYGTYIG